MVRGDCPKFSKVQPKRALFNRAHCPVVKTRKMTLPGSDPALRARDFAASDAC
jgi:hypothetical protein